MARKYALLVGIDDYSTYDRSAGQPAGTSDLRGAVNDALAWGWLCQSRGYAEQDVRFLLSPAQGRALPAEQPLPEASRAPADRAAVLAGIAWLCGRLLADPGAEGILAWSGHGAGTEAGLGLCPADVAIEGGELRGELPFAQIDVLLEALPANHRLTVALDACHASGFERGGRRVLRGRSPGLRSPARRLSTEVPVLAACRSQEVSAEERFGATWQGAFTWAVTSVLQRWGRPGEGGVDFPITYGELVERAGRVLEPLDFAQVPVLEGEAHADRLVFSQAEASSSGARPSNGREIHPGDGGAYRVYDLADDAGTTIARILAIGTQAPTGYDADSEYWDVRDTATLSTTRFIRFTILYEGTSAKPGDHGWTGSVATAHFAAPGQFDPLTGPVQPLQGLFSAGIFLRENSTTACRFYLGTSTLQTVWLRDKPSLIFSGSGANTRFDRIGEKMGYIIQDPPLALG